MFLVRLLPPRIHWPAERDGLDGASFSVREWLRSCAELVDVLLTGGAGRGLERAGAELRPVLSATWSSTGCLTFLTLPALMELCLGRISDPGWAAAEDLQGSTLGLTLVCTAIPELVGR